MTLLRSFALAALTAAGLAGTASAQFPGYPYPPPPVRSFPPSHSHSHRPPLVVEQPVFTPPVVVQRPVLEPLVPAVPVYCYDTFARDFRPCPGKHHIAIIHPVTKCPVEVCFTLPDRKLKEVEVNRRDIEFKYGLGFHKVELDFRRDGTVRVND
jgi:hypothetical protein